MACKVGKTTSFAMMMLLTTSFFLVEIVVGYITNSMALVADSFHMLSDIISLAVGFFALKFSRKNSAKGNTFGWVRAGVLGALINAVFLVALCLSIFISALKRLVDTEPLNNPILILVVGCLGLLVNILGMFLFHGHAGHGHSHGGHGHSHGGHGHSHAGHGHSHGGHGHNHGSDHGHSHGNSKCHGHGKKDGKTVNNSKTIENGNAMENGTIDHANNVCKKNNHLAAVTLQCDNPPGSPSLRRIQEKVKSVEVLFEPQEEHTEEKAKKEESDCKDEGELNMRGVYLHILGDALGSVIVIIAAIIVHFVHAKWTLYVDPALSLVMVFIILHSSVPLLKESSMILLQNVPPHIQVSQLEERLLKAFPEILGIHEFHVWQLAGNKIIASVHVKFNSKEEYSRISPNLKEFFHGEGIHSTTFQPEFFEEGQGADYDRCLLACVSKSCIEKLCCAPTPPMNNNKLEHDNNVKKDSLKNVQEINEIISNGNLAVSKDDDNSRDNDSFEQEAYEETKTVSNAPVEEFKASPVEHMVCFDGDDCNV